MNIHEERINIAQNQAALYAGKYTNPVATKTKIFNDLNERLHARRKMHPKALADIEDTLTDLDAAILRTAFTAVECCD